MFKNGTYNDYGTDPRDGEYYSDNGTDPIEGEFHSSAETNLFAQYKESRKRAAGFVGTVVGHAGTWLARNSRHTSHYVRTTRAFNYFFHQPDRAFEHELQQMHYEQKETTPTSTPLSSPKRSSYEANSSFFKPRHEEKMTDESDGYHEESSWRLSTCLKRAVCFGRRKDHNLYEEL